MISFILGLVIGVVICFLFRDNNDEEVRDLSELLESIAPEQMKELSNVLSPDQLNLIARMYARREYEATDAAAADESRGDN